MKKCISLLFFFLFSIVCFLPEMNWATESPLQASSLNVNKVDLYGKDLISEKKINIDVGSSSGLVLVFLSALCPCSNSHIQELKSLTKIYSDFKFVGIHSNTNESRSLSQSYFKKIHLPFPVLQDTGAQLANKYKAYKTPHVFVLLRGGKMVYQGGVSDSHQFSNADRKYLREALEDIHSHREVKTPEARTLGCIITRGDKNDW